MVQLRPHWFRDLILLKTFWQSFSYEFLGILDASRSWKISLLTLKYWLGFPSALCVGDVVVNKFTSSSNMFYLFASKLTLFLLTYIIRRAYFKYFLIFFISFSLQCPWPEHLGLPQTMAATTSSKGKSRFCFWSNYTTGPLVPLLPGKTATNLYTYRLYVSDKFMELSILV